MVINLNTKELEYFKKTYESKSIKQASEKLFISSQGLSKIINKLENELSVQLFVRNRQGIEPTTYADKLYQKTQSIIAELDSIKLINKYTNMEKKVLKVVSTYGILSYLTIDFISDFYKEYPSILLDIVEFPDYPLKDILFDEKAEIGFMIGPVDPARFDAYYFTTNRYCLIINKKNYLASKSSIKFQDLKGIPLAIKGREFDIYKNNTNHFLKAGIKPEILLETSEEQLIFQAAIKNIGIGVTLDYIAHNYCDKNIVIRPFADKKCLRDVYIVNKSNIDLSEEAINFQNFALEWIKKNQSNLFQSND